MPEDTTREQTERGELERAFDTFNLLSSQLQRTYHALQQRVAKLSDELEDARRARERAAATAERTAERLQLAARHAARGSSSSTERLTSKRPIDAAEEILGANLAGKPWAAAVARGMFANPRSGRRRLDYPRRPARDARSELGAAGGREDHPADGRHGDARAAGARDAQSALERDRQDGRKPRASNSHATRGRTALSLAMPHASRRAQRSALLEKGIDRLRHLERLIQDMLVFARGKGPGERVRVAELFSRRARRCARGEAAERAPRDRRRRRVRGARRQSHRAHGRAHEFDQQRIRVLAERRRHAAARRHAATASSSPCTTTGPASRRASSRACSSRSSRRVPAGTGLGLAVVKTVAEAHGGALALDSVQGRGTRIELDLPRRAERANSARRNRRFRIARKRGRMSEPATILVVEDDRPLQDALVSTLVTAGYKVLAAADGGEALKVLARLGGRSRRERRADATRRRLTSFCGACGKNNRLLPFS